MLKGPLEEATISSVIQNHNRTTFRTTTRASEQQSVMASKDWPRGQPEYVPPKDDGVTRVVHLKLHKGKIIQDCDVYIGRRNCMGGWDLPQSKWANPFKMRDYKNNRELVTEKYREHILSQPQLMESLQELKGKRLGCWCKPLQCHGDILLELVNKLDQTRKAATVAGATNFDLNDLKDDFPPLLESKSNTTDQHQGATHKQESQEFKLAAPGGATQNAESTTQPQGLNKSKRRKHRTPHLHVKSANTPKWNFLNEG